MCLERGCNTIAFPQSSSLHTVNVIVRENPFSLNELIGYADLTVFQENWSEHSLIDMEQNCIGELLYFKYFPCGSLKRNRLRKFFDSQT